MNISDLVKCVLFILVIASGVSTAPTHAHSPAPLNIPILYVKCGDINASGVVISESGYALTAAHVVKGHTGFCKGKIDAIGETLTIEIVEKTLDENSDIALLKITDKRAYEKASLCAIQENDMGKSTFIYGFPAVSSDSRYVIRQGILSSVQKNQKRHFQINTIMQSGMSGGPVVLDTGQVFGVISGAIEEAYGDHAYYASSYLLPFDLQNYVDDIGEIGSCSTEPSKKIIHWSSEEGDVPTDVKAGRNICYISGIKHDRNALENGDSETFGVTIAEVDGFYHIVKTPGASGSVSVTITCVGI